MVCIYIYSSPPFLPLLCGLSGLPFWGIFGVGELVGWTKPSPQPVQMMGLSNFRCDPHSAQPAVDIELPPLLPRGGDESVQRSWRGVGVGITAVSQGDSSSLSCVCSLPLCHLPPRWPGKKAPLGGVSSAPPLSPSFSIHFPRALLIDSQEHHLEERGKKTQLNINCVFLFMFLLRAS